MKNIAEQILEGLSKFYVGFQNRRVLKTMEEIEANTDEQNLPSALLLGEINNKLMFPDGTEFYLDEKDGERGYNSDPARGADTFTPFKRQCQIETHLYSWANYIMIPNAPRRVRVQCAIDLFLFDMNTETVFKSGKDIILIGNTVKNIKIKSVSSYADNVANGPSYRYPINITLG